MPTEPKRSIEAELQALAKQRRDAAGTPFSPHPATRKMLQDEVARTFPKPHATGNETPARHWLAGLWIRFAFAGGTMALLVLAAIYWLPKENEQTIQLAQQPAIGPGAVSHLNEAELQKPADERADFFQAARDAVPVVSAQPPSLAANEPAKLGVSELSVESKSAATRPDLAGRAVTEKSAVELASKTEAPALASLPSVSLNEPPRPGQGRAGAGGFGGGGLGGRGGRGAGGRGGRGQRGVEGFAPPPVQEQAQPSRASEITDATASARFGVAPQNGSEGIASSPPKTDVPVQTFRFDRQAASSDTKPIDGLALNAPTAPAAATPTSTSDDLRPGFRSGAANSSPENRERQPAETPGRARLALTDAPRPAESELGAKAKSLNEVALSFANRESASVQWSFQQVNSRTNLRRNVNSPPVPAILHTFQVQQSGSTLRVQDADGSVYEGGFDAPVQRGLVTATRASSAAEIKSQTTAQGQGAFFKAGADIDADAFQKSQSNSQIFGRPFRVTGTNRTLNQLVVFTGQLQQATNVSPETLGRNAAADSSRVSELELQGKANVGQRTEIPIQAVGTLR